MNFADFEKVIIDLNDKESFESADKMMEEFIPVVVSLHDTDLNEQKKFLRFYSDVAGDAESFDRLTRLLNLLLEKGYISKTEADLIMNNTPANRWF